MQEGPKEGLLKILKGHENLWRSALKMGRDDLNDFESDSEPLKGPLKNFEDASEGEVEPWDFNGDFNENQLETEWDWLRSERAQQRLS